MTSSEPSRRDVLADAAIGIVARGGMRALTHRAVDADATMPPGTTSAYFRTRSALVVAVTERLAALNAQDLAGMQLGAGGPLMGGPDATGTGTRVLDHVAERTGDLIVHMTTTARARTLARYHCMLETTHRPELHSLLRFRETARGQTAELLRRAGAPDPDGRAREYMAAIDGMILDRILEPSHTADPPHPAVRRLLHAAAAGT